MVNRGGNRLGPYGVFTPNKQNSSEWNFGSGQQSPRGDIGATSKPKRTKKSKQPVSNIKDIMGIYADVKQTKWCNDKLPPRYTGQNAAALAKTIEGGNH